MSSLLGKSSVELQHGDFIMRAFSNSLPTECLISALKEVAAQSLFHAHLARHPLCSVTKHKHTRLMLACMHLQEIMLPYVCI